MLIDALNHRLENNAAKKLQRQHAVITSRTKTDVAVNGHLLKNYAGNDYLGLAMHAEIKHAFIEGVEKYGVGSGSSVAVSGYYEPQWLLEQAFAEFMQRDAAIFFNSGYHANLALITTLCDRNSTILSDKLCHASILDGIQLSRAKHLRFKHNNSQHAGELISAGSLVVTESVFSMEGDISPLHDLAQLASQNQSVLLVDDAHGVGVLGQNGRGITEHLQLSQKDIPCLVTPFGKAMGGMGAMVSGSQLLIDGLRQFARTYHYTTALPPAVAYAALTTLKLVKADTWRRERLQQLIQIVIDQANYYSLPLVSDDPTAIKSIVIGKNNHALAIQNELMQRGYLVSCIRPPTVPDGTARIRLSINCMHEEDDILQLVSIMAGAYEKYQ